MPASAPWAGLAARLLLVVMVALSGAVGVASVSHPFVSPDSCCLPHGSTGLLPAARAPGSGEVSAGRPTGSLMAVSQPPARERYGVVVDRAPRVSSSNLSATGYISPSAGGVPLNVTFGLCPISGGLPPYTVVTHFGDGSTFSGPVSSFNGSWCYAYAVHLYRVAGTYTGMTWVNDSANGSVSWVDTVTAEAVPPSITVPVATPSTIDLGQTTALTVTPSGGTGSYSVYWSGLPSGCAGGKTTTLQCTPNASGRFGVSAAVVDSAGVGAVNASLELTVYADPVVVGTRITPATVDVGQQAALIAEISGGSALRYVAWSGLPAGCTSTNTTVLACVPTAVGSYRVAVSVRDTDGVTANGTPVGLEVDPQLLVTPVELAPPVIDVGQSTSFTSLASGGLGSYSYAWTGLPPGCGTADRATLECTPTAAGSFNVSMEATDANGDRVSSQAGCLKVITRLVVSFAATPLNLTEGGSLALEATIAGGLAPFTLQYSGLPPGCSALNASSLHCLPQQAGRFLVTVSVSDSINSSAAANVTVVVLANQSSVNSTASHPDGGLSPLVGVAIGVIAVLPVSAVYLAFRRRRR